MRRSNARTVNPCSSENEDMDPIKLQFRSNRPGFRSPKHKQSNLKFRLCFYTSISIAIVLFCYILFFRSKNHEKIRYGLVIDGGSTGTRIHVFKYQIRGGDLDFDFSEKGLVSMRVNPGLSAYVDEPEKAGGAMAELLEFAKRNVPREQWGETDVRLMATAGMRLLKNEDQERILNACRRILRTPGFRFRDDWASVISGSDEGLYAWVVANYALGTLGSEPTQTTGIIELGGASAQVTFVSNEPMPSEFSRKVKFGNFTYNLYSHSLLQFGQYAHRKCVQYWCNEKGDTTCEICHQTYQPGYTAPPRPPSDETTIDIGGVWQLSGTPLDMHDPRLLAIAEAERQLFEADYDDYNGTNSSGAAFCRSVALILMALLLLRHALSISDDGDSDGEDDASAFFSLFLLRAVGFLLPCYIMIWAISILQRRRERQEAVALAAATQFAIVVQSAQNRGLLVASAAPPAPQVAPLHENV